MEDYKTVFRRLKEQVDKSNYQKDLHFASSEQSETPIRTHFLNIKRKETWSFRNNIKLECSGDISNPNFITYKVKSLPFHGLLHTVLVQNLPQINAAPGYEVRWCKNVGYNVIRNCSIKVNDVEWQSLNSEYFDDFMQKINMDKDEEINKDLGNVPELREWSPTLYPYQTFFWIPWFYSSHSSKMFPLYFCGKEDNIVHEMLLRRNLSELLQVRRVDTHEVIPFDENCVTINTPLTVPVPEVRGEYEFMSDMECEHNRCEESKVRYSTQVFDIDNVKSIDSDNIHNLNTTVNIKIKDMPFPVHTIHWKAINLEARKYNEYSNYSTNSHDCMRGGNPIKWISLSTPQGILFKNQDFYIGERIVSKQNFNKVPKEPGYGCWTNAPNATDSLYPKPGINLNDSELTFRLENNEFHSNDSFRVNIQIVYTYRITINDYPKSETERNVKGIDFEISGDM